MTDAALAALARQAGIASEWKDVFGAMRPVGPQTLRAILHALDLPAGSDRQLAESRAILAEEAASTPPVVTGQAGEAIVLPGGQAGRYRITLEDGSVRDGRAGEAIRLDMPGLHRLESDGRETTLAVAPRQAWTVEEAKPAGGAWGIAVQLYALRRQGDGGIGDFAALAAFARHAAAQGADAVAISPVHAQFSADPDRFSPYAPSSRAALNVLHTPVDLHGEAAARLEAAPLIDWPAASRLRLEALRAAHAQAMRDPAEGEALAAFLARGGRVLHDHAVFEALHADRFARDPTQWHWRHWPAELRDPRSDAVRAFAAEHAPSVSWHGWMQFAADRGLAAAQAAARDAGMGIGLIADLAVGADSGGSHAWTRQDEILRGMTIGAPPDLFQKDGQAWGISAFSPRGLRQHGFAAFLDMLRVALAHAGGVRIDHAMGLSRLWVVPEGASSADGAYLAMPEADLLRLLALHSRRQRAVVLAEDLGTVPDGFSDRLAAAGMLGMRVLWFERDQAQNFTQPAHWTRSAVAMTGTHDLPTVAGWWRGTDIDWRERTGTTGDAPAERWDRGIDRDRLWRAFCDSGAAAWPPPPPDAPDAAVDAACVHVGGSDCALAMIPIEDARAATEQPNLPGTTEQHPNWRRRLPGQAAALLSPAAVQARLAALAAARGRT